jgi:hypothetical protein
MPLDINYISAIACKNALPRLPYSIIIHIPLKHDSMFFHISNVMDDFIFIYNSSKAQVFSRQPFLRADFIVTSPKKRFTTISILDSSYIYLATFNCVNQKWQKIQQLKLLYKIS